MTPELWTFTPHERAEALEALTALVDATLERMVAAHEADWARHVRAGALSPGVRQWYRDVLDRLLRDVRADVLTLLRKLLPPTSVH